MQRGPLTVVLAVVFYTALLFWASAWRAADETPEIADSPAPSPSPESVEPAATATAPEPEPAKHLAPAEFAAERSPDGTWEIGGQFASSSVADAIHAALETDGRAPFGEIAVSAEVAPAAWGDALARWIPKQAAAIKGRTELGAFGGQLLLAGNVASAEERDALLAAAQSHFADTGLEVVGEFEINVPSEPAEFALVPGENGGYQVAGRLGDAKLKTRILTIIAEITGGAAVEDSLTIGEEIALAPWGASLLQVLPALLVEVEQPQIMASASTFLMAGSIKGDNTRQALAQMVEQSFAGVPVSIENQLAVMVVTEPASLSISRGEDGKLTITGQLPEGIAIDDFLKTARAAAGDQAPSELLGSGADIGDAPWLEEMTKLVPAFAETARWGALSVHGDQVALEAKVENAETADVLTSLVRNAFPEPDYKCLVEVSIAAPTGPSDEDIAALEQIVKDTVIYFASNSDQLTPDGRSAAEDIAAAMTKVPGSGIALLGHADSTGRASYNRKLSKRRCDTVGAVLEEAGIESLLIETEIIGESDARADTGKRYESARRVEFELR